MYTFLRMLCWIWKEDNSVTVTTRLRTGRPGLNSRQGQDIFLYSTVSRLVLGPTQTSIQCVPGALSLGVKRPGLVGDQ
jgi:hypothetical protein